jgi:hypothetical protein
MSTSTIKALPVRVSWVRDWPRWAPYPAVVWSLIYATLGFYWAMSGREFPYTPELGSDVLGPIAGRFGPVVAWIIVIMEGIPAVVLGVVMLRGGRRFRSFLISVGVLIAMVLLLLMADINLLTTLGYVPYTLYGLLTGSEIGRIFLSHLLQDSWVILHQLFCLFGGFLWLVATVSYTRRSGDACIYCGRRDNLAGWNSPANAARWNRVAVYVAMIAPIIYALTRYAWAVGIPLGMSEGHLRLGQENGTWTSGLFLATFDLVGAILMLGLVQRWGEVFPSWMIGLGKRRVPIALAVVPASIVSVLLMVGGISIWSAYAQMAKNAMAVGENVLIVVGPTLLFPLWAVSLAVATLGYYYRRRGPCEICGRGLSY